eukprot:SAG11_NODE_2093_length_3834_cov_2.402945_4_plen_68_part_00
MTQSFGILNLNAGNCALRSELALSGRCALSTRTAVSLLGQVFSVGVSLRLEADRRVFLCNEHYIIAL